MNNCPSGKRSFDNQELAEEALIQNHIRNYHRTNGGPINIYSCRDCGVYHFTSKGEIHNLLLDEGSKERIKKEQQADFWERKLR